MKKLSILVCDDQKEILDSMEKLLLRYEKEHECALDIKCTDDYSTCQLEADFHPDLLFLDIEMPGKSGLEIRDELEKSGDKGLIIFITNHSEKIWDAFGRNVIGFFAKPIEYERLCQLMNKFFSLHRVYDMLELDRGRSVAVGDIIWIGADDVYSEVQLSSGKRISLRRSLLNWENMLPMDCFLKISNKYIVNCYYIANLEGRRICLDDNSIDYGEELIISVRRKKECEEKYLAYCRKMARYGDQ